MSLSRSFINGKVVSNPESRFTNTDDPVTRISVITGSGVQVSLTCYRGLAEKANNLKEGDLIMASGNLITSTQQSSDGMSKKSFELNVRDLFLLHGSVENLNPFGGNEGGKAAYSSQPSSNQAQTQQSNTGNAQSSQEEDLSEVLLEEEIPF